MSLDQVISEISYFLMHDSFRALVDISGHLLTGAFLAERYFPESPISKKAAIGFCSGLLPDFDYFTLGLIPHKTATHTISFGAMMAVNAYNANFEDREREREQNNYACSFYEKIKLGLTSRWAKITALGIGLHLILDYVFSGNQDGAAYCALAAAALTVQIAYNLANNRYQRHKKPQKIVPCIVVDGEGSRYWVSGQTQAHTRPGEYHESVDYKNGKGLPLCFVPDYKYPTDEGRELVREFQTRYMPKGPSIWERIDYWFLKSYIALKQACSHSRS